jgi:hypothetical protein
VIAARRSARGGDAAPMRPAARIGWGLCLLVIIMVAVALLFRLGTPEPSSMAAELGDWLLTTSAIPCAVVGALITARRPGNPIGGLLLAIGLTLAGFSLADAYFPYGLTRPNLPGLRLAAWLTAWLWIPALAALNLLLLVYPTGRLVSPRWRPVAWLIAGWAALFVLFLALYPDVEVDGVSFFPDPLGPSGRIAKVLDHAWPVFSLLSPVLLLASAGSLLVRFRRAGGVERQQLKWLAYVGGLAVLLNPLLLVLSVAFLTWGIPVAIGIAILRYRLYDIDLLINRTLVYGLLTAVLGLGYAVVVLVLGQFFGGVTGDPPSWVIAGATLAVAALFQPARRRIQATVDRYFNRRRYDAVKTIEAFSARLRDEIDLDTLTAELLAVVDQTMQPTRASLWLRPQAVTMPERPPGTTVLSGE